MSTFSEPSTTIYTYIHKTNTSINIGYRIQEFLNSWIHDDIIITLIAMSRLRPQRKYPQNMSSFLLSLTIDSPSSIPSVFLSFKIYCVLFPDRTIASVYILICFIEAITKSASYGRWSWSMVSTINISFKTLCLSLFLVFWLQCECPKMIFDENRTYD